MKYLFRFGYESPAQHVANTKNGWDDESSGAFWVDSPDAAKLPTNMFISCLPRPASRRLDLGAKQSLHIGLRRNRTKYFLRLNLRAYLWFRANTPQTLRVGGLSRGDVLSRKRGDGSVEIRVTITKNQLLSASGPEGTGMALKKWTVSKLIQAARW
jgi:hypothetical protein